MEWIRTIFFTKMELQLSGIKIWLLWFKIDEWNAIFYTNSNRKSTDFLRHFSFTYLNTHKNWKIGFFIAKHTRSKTEAVSCSWAKVVDSFWHIFVQNLSKNGWFCSFHGWWTFFVKALPLMAQRESFWETQLHQPVAVKIQ